MDIYSGTSLNLTSPAIQCCTIIGSGTTTNLSVFLRCMLTTGNCPPCYQITCIPCGATSSLVTRSKGPLHRFISSKKFSPSCTPKMSLRGKQLLTACETYVLTYMLKPSLLKMLCSCLRCSPDSNVRQTIFAQK